MTTHGRATPNPYTFAHLCISLQIILAVSLVHPQSRLDQQALEKFQQGRYQEASELAQQAIERDGSNAVYQELYGMVLAALGKSSEAEVHLRKAVALRPQQPEFHYNLAQLLLDRQEASGLHPFAPSSRRLMEEAISELKRVLEINGRYSNASRGKRRQAATRATGNGASPASDSEEHSPAESFSQQQRRSWARLLRKVYEIDPLECPECSLKSSR